MRVGKGWAARIEAVRCVGGGREGRGDWRDEETEGC